MKEYESIPMDPHMFDHLIGRSQGTRNMFYTWRDISLYALGVGCTLEDTPYVYERAEGGMKPLPTFAMIPYINNITMDKIDKIPHGTNEFVRDWMEEKLGYMPVGLHIFTGAQLAGYKERRSRGPSSGPPPLNILGRNQTLYSMMQLVSSRRP